MVRYMALDLQLNMRLRRGVGVGVVDGRLRIGRKELVIRGAAGAEGMNLVAVR